jgi:hypothetical protein
MKKIDSKTLDDILRRKTNYYGPKNCHQSMNGEP